MFWESRTEKQIDELNEVMKEYSARIVELEEKLKNKPDKVEKDAYERIADLEVKMAKLWALLIDSNNLKKEDRLSKFGKVFGGKARDRL